MLPIQSLRLAWFSTEITKSDAEKLYLSLFKQEPDRLTASKHPTQQNPFLETVSGVVDETNIEIQRQIGRIDLVVQPLDLSEDGGNAVPNLLDTKSVFLRVLSALQFAEWLPDSQRISVVASALSISSSLIEAREKLASCLGQDLGIPEASDHFFQINRKTNINGSDCNRVVQLSVVEFRTMEVSVENSQSTQNVVSSSQALSIVYDFNTVPRGQAFNMEEQTAIIRGLFAEIERAMNIGGLDFLKDK